VTEKEELISIIVPVYNVEAYIEQCLDSLLNQTYRNLEIILIDDGSTDNSGKICEAYEKKDYRIKYFYQTNMGVGAARNKGIDFAAGKYIGFVDPDDYCDLEMFRKLYSLIKKYKVTIACCLRNDMNNDDINLGGYIFQEKERVCTKAEVLNRYTQTMDWSVCNKLYSREVIRKNRFPEINFGEDFFTVFKWLYSADKIVYLQEGLYYYRRNRPGSATSSRNDLLCKIEASLLQLHQFNSMLIEINDSKLIKNFNVRYLRSLYDLRCNIENTEESEEKRILLNTIDIEIKKLDIYKETLGRSKSFKLFLLENFKIGYKLLLLWESVFKDMERKIRKIKW
jgi:glycosyltransferase involved in cell wall biosynthesis